jgi:hypothetical protein
MSKGPGYIERQLAEIFAKNPGDPFSTRALCLHVYRTREVQKKHRVSVLRALKKIAKSSMPTLRRRVLKFERDDEWFDSRTGTFPVKGTARATDPRPRKG